MFLIKVLTAICFSKTEKVSIRSSSQRHLIKKKQESRDEPRSENRLLFVTLNGTY